MHFSLMAKLVLTLNHPPQPTGGLKKSLNSPVSQKLLELVNHATELQVVFLS